jgi:hypothetical protein
VGQVPDLPSANSGRRIDQTPPESGLSVRIPCIHRLPTLSSHFLDTTLASDEAAFEQRRSYREAPISVVRLQNRGALACRDFPAVWRSGASVSFRAAREAEAKLVVCAWCGGGNRRTPTGTRNPPSSRRLAVQPPEADGRAGNNRERPAGTHITGCAHLLWLGSVRTPPREPETLRLSAEPCTPG